MTNAASALRLHSLCVLLLFVTVRSAWGVDPNRPVSSYNRNHFTYENGLPSNVVHHMVQSRDGFLLLEAAGKVARFDGRHFYVFGQPELINAMALAEDGDLWVGTDTDLEKIPAGAFNQFRRVPTTSYHPDPGKSSHITSIYLTRNAVLWVGTPAGLYRFKA